MQEDYGEPENGPYFAYDADEWTEKTMGEDDED